MTDALEKVGALLSPKSIAIVGASPTETGGRSWSFQAFKNLQGAGYSGEIYPVNPRYPEVWDRTCYPDLASLPEVPDQVLLIVPVGAALPILEEAGAAGTRSAVLYAAGFTESLTEEGTRRSEALRSQLAESGVGLCGPNCMGYAAFPSRSLTYPGITVNGREGDGSVAIVAQSGAVTGSLYRSLLGMGMLARYVISSGNELGLSVEDYLEYFISDPGVETAVLFIESLKDPDRFLELCELAGEREMPVIAVKIGMSPQAQESVVAHTGRLAGNGRVFVDVAAASGAITARTIDEAIDIAAIFRPGFLPQSRRLGGVTRSGGMRNVLIDSAAQWGMEFPNLTEKTFDGLAARIDVGMAVGNPIDIGQHGNITLDCVREIAEDPNTDVVISQISTSSAGSGGAQKASEFQGVADDTGKLVVLTTYKLEAAPSLGSPGVGFCVTPDRAVSALRRLYDFKSWLEREPVSPADAPPTGPNMIDELACGATGILDEDRSKQLIESYGFTTPKRQLVSTRGEAEAAARAIAGPMIAKVVSSAVPHKSALGLLSPILTMAEEAGAEFDRLSARCAEVLPPGTEATIWIEEAVLGGIECALGLSRDSDFGLVVMFGAGGALLEHFDDVVFSRPINDTASALGLITRTKIGRMLSTSTGRRFDVDELARHIVAMGNLARDGEKSIEAVDLNPITVREVGLGAVVLDASVVLS